MKGEASGSNNEISAERYEEDTIVSILPAIVDALECQVHEEDVREGIDDFCRVSCGIVVLVCNKLGT